MDCTALIAYMVARNTMHRVITPHLCLRVIILVSMVVVMHQVVEMAVDTVVVSFVLHHLPIVPNHMLLQIHLSPTFQQLNSQFHYG